MESIAGVETEQAAAGAEQHHSQNRAHQELLVEELLVEEISIDGMCGVY